MNILNTSLKSGKEKYYRMLIVEEGSLIYSLLHTQTYTNTNNPDTSKYNCGHSEISGLQYLKEGTSASKPKVEMATRQTSKCKRASGWCNARTP